MSIVIGSSLSLFVSITSKNGAFIFSNLVFYTQQNYFILIGTLLIEQMFIDDS